MVQLRQGIGKEDQREAHDMLSLYFVLRVMPNR
jgi:hypothetical protein